MEIVLQPVLADLDNNTLNNLGNDISREFENIKVTVSSATNNSNLMQLKKDITFQSSFDNHRNQWYSPKLLEWILDNFKPTRRTKILGILDIDAYSGGFDFVFGEAFYRGRVAAIYLSRLRQEFYGLDPNPSLFYERLVKEAIHELGHVFGLRHCKNSRCVMYFSTSLLDIDTKRKNFCHDSAKKNFR